MPTRDELEQLKQRWLDEPSWSLPETPGFEAYAEELDEFQTITTKRWQLDYELRMQTRSAELGVPGDADLVTAHNCHEWCLEDVDQKLAVTAEHEPRQLLQTLRAMRTMLSHQGDQILKLQKELALLRRAYMNS